MLSLLVSFVNMVYELAGDFGLAFFLFIVSVNVYHFHWQLPQKIQVSATPSFEEAKSRSLRVKLYSTLPLLILGFFVVGMLIIPGPVLWLKVLAGSICLLILGSILSTIGQLVVS